MAPFYFRRKKIFSESENKGHILCRIFPALRKVQYVWGFSQKMAVLEGQIYANMQIRPKQIQILGFASGESDFFKSKTNPTKLFKLNTMQSFIFTKSQYLTLNQGCEFGT